MIRGKSDSVYESIIIGPISGHVEPESFRMILIEPRGKLPPKLRGSIQKESGISGISAERGGVANRDLESIALSAAMSISWTR